MSSLKTVKLTKPIDLTHSKWCFSPFPGIFLRPRVTVYSVRYDPTFGDAPEALKLGACHKKPLCKLLQVNLLSFLLLLAASQVILASVSNPCLWESQRTQLIVCLLSTKAMQIT